MIPSEDLLFPTYWRRAHNVMMNKKSLLTSDEDTAWNGEKYVLAVVAITVLYHSIARATGSADEDEY